MTDTGDLIAESLGRLLAERVTPAVLEAADGGAGAAALWTELDALGATRVLVPESAGGVGASWRDAHAVIRAAGHHAIPAPLPETVAATWLLATVGLPTPQGPATWADGSKGAVVARRTDGQWRLSGRVARVPFARVCPSIVTQCDGPDGPLVALVDRSEVTCVPDQNLALEPRDAVVWEDSRAVCAGPAPAHTPSLHRVGALMRAAQMAGALERILSLAVRYASDRVQFGRPIARFQAIQMQLAEMAELTAAAGVAAEAGFRAMDRGDAEFEIAVAKIKTGEAAQRGSAIAHQVHGAFGFTYECPLHFFTRRLMSWRLEHGTDAWWACRLGAIVADLGPDGLWPYLTGRP